MEYTTQEVADGFGVHLSTVLRWVHERGLRSRVVNLHGKRVYRHEDVIAFAQEHGLTFAPAKKKK